MLVDSPKAAAHWLNHDLETKVNLWLKTLLASSFSCCNKQHLDFFSKYKKHLGLKLSERPMHTYESYPHPQRNSSSLLRSKKFKLKHGRNFLHSFELFLSMQNWITALVNKVTSSKQFKRKQRLFLGATKHVCETVLCNLKSRPSASYLLVAGLTQHPKSLRTLKPRSNLFDTYNIQFVLQVILPYSDIRD